MRKLSVNDRLIGALKLAEKHNLPCEYICIGIAAGMMFAPSSDERSVELYNFAKENGAKLTLEKYCEYNGAKTELICSLYDMLKNGKQISALSSYCDEVSGKTIRV